MSFKVFFEDIIEGIDNVTTRTISVDCQEDFSHCLKESCSEEEVLNMILKACGENPDNG